MENTDRVGVGIIGCGNISSAYLKAAPNFPILNIRAVADLNPDTAAKQAEAFGTQARSVEALLASDDIEVIINLTIPQAHVEVGIAALEADKHVYSEKPLAVTFADGQKLVAKGEETGLRVGCAPDTFLGGSHQTCRNLVDAGGMGRIVGGSACFMCPGHERWHPNPAFYYAKGGGPMLDMGPYYVTDLVNLLGPVARVSGMGSMLRKTREITSEPLKGQSMDVDVPTHVAGLLEFVSGAIVQITMSFDVAGHRHTPIEIYGTDASLLVPDPNHFGGKIERMAKGGEWEEIAFDMPYHDGNFRSLGVADMAHAIRSGRPHRASGALALHALEVMEAIGIAGETGQRIDITTRPERPAALKTDIADGAIA
ncbi:Gfo/Idh/MocA family protein [Pelagibacterium montanilacus]|uniref:Gfo/Idh/MocA family protein n=1 Tax=Pelagibacterium montanilacus TaxID=2185280 RepID=UPI000F8EF95F|nr:Gfo/Idh/MocA family oxidoreductase [Pelagibacterium montanilacus]